MMTPVGAFTQSRGTTGDDGGLGRGNSGGNGGNNGGDHSGGLGRGGGGSHSEGNGSSGGGGNGGLGRGNSGGNNQSGGYGGGGTSQSQGSHYPYGSSSNNSSIGSLGRGNEVIPQGAYSPGGRATQWSPRPNQTSYRSNNNLTSRSGLGNQIRITNPPYVNPRLGSLSNLVNNRNNIRVNYNWRNGYHYYNYNGWNDNFFYYPYYDFSIFGSPCVYSPWYYYPCLPPYLNYSRTVVIETPWMGNFGGLEYNYQPSNFGSNDNFSNYGQSNGNATDDPSLNRALNDLVSTFDNKDGNALDRIVPQQGSIAVFLNDQYNYSIQPNDLYGLLRDNSQSVRTVSYEILNVRTSGDRARVLALQTYIDPWGQTQRVYHELMFQLNGNEATISQFGTSLDRPW